MTPQEFIRALEIACGFPIKETKEAELNKKSILDTQAEFFSKKHYYDEDGLVISKEEATK